MSRARKPPKPLAPHYATAIAIVYDTICCPCCTCPEHRSGKIRSEIRFDSMPPTETFRGWSKHVTSFPLDRERGNGPMNAKAVRTRAAILAELIGVPLRDETDIPVNLRRA